MRSSRLMWIGLGAGAGYLLGARAGQERYRQLAGWGQRASRTIGLPGAVARVAGASEEAAASGVTAAATAAADTLVDLSDDLSRRQGREKAVTGPVGTS